MRIAIDSSTHVLVLTGAGISAESGVPTFRDAGGLWEGHDVTAVASPEGFARDPLLVWRFYSQRRAAMTGIEPNAAHRALVDLEHRLGDRFLLATQNVERAVLRRRHQPRRWILRHAAELPHLECATERVLHHVLRQREVVDAEQIGSASCRAGV